MTGTDTDPTPAPAAPADPAFSEDQAAALALLSDALAGAGVDLEARTAVREDPDETARPPARVVAVLGKAGSGKTHLLADLVARLLEAGARQVGSEADPRRPGQGSGQGPGRRRRKKAKGPEPATFAVVAPTNKAASVLRARGVAASTIHRIIYSPIYDPDYE
ncbi:MAG: AAA family ATPase, partial [Pseudomonadota bacterium]